jgi:radical SAM superfamily enzyme YgiQ (UPF0313 family)
LRLIGASGCHQLLVGFETPTAASLQGVELRSNWKYRKRDLWREAIERIQGHGITLNGCCVLDLDGDTEEVFDLIPRFVEDTALYDVQVTIATPFPGTPFYRRLLAEGRLLEPCNWRRSTLFDVNFRSARMTPEWLERKFRQLVRELDSEEAVLRRHPRFGKVYGPKFREPGLEPCGT